MWGSDNNSKDEVASNKVAKPAKPTSTVDTLIGRQSELSGDIRFAGGLHVDGKIKGKVIAESDKNAVLSISESGSVEGDIRVPHVVLNGTVEGDVHAAARITLSAKARVNGNVYYKLIEMTSGAMVNGQMVYEGESAEKVTAIPPARRPVEDPNSRDKAAAGGTTNTGVSSSSAAANQGKISL